MGSGHGGALVISLDFEMHWGVRDHWTVDDYRENLEGERKVIPLLLKMFRAYEIHATWATVGFLFFETKADLLAHLPARLPAYKTRELSPYPFLQTLGENEASAPYHFAPSLLALIREVPHQEIGSHTFSHYFCLEDGQTVEAFRADSRAAVDTARRNGLTLKSFVFPRNQFQESYLEVCREMGIRAYRGNERSWIYRAKNEDHQSRFQRAVRLLDAYLPISGHNTYPIETIPKTIPCNVPSSRFLRPYVPVLRWFEWLRVRRILSGMTYAATHNEVYHLWWHPHNFGANMEKNFAILETILRHYRSLQKKYGMRSLHMAEVADEVLGK